MSFLFIACCLSVDMHVFVSASQKFHACTHVASLLFTFRRQTKYVSICFVFLFLFLRVCDLFGRVLALCLHRFLTYFL